MSDVINEHTPRRRWVGAGFIGICGVVAVLLVLGLASGPGTTETVDLRPGVWLQGGAVVLQNQDGFDWTGVRLRVNREYTAPVGRVTSWQTVRVPLRGLVSVEGRRYDPQQTRVSTVDVEAQTPHGAGFIRWLR